MKHTTIFLYGPSGSGKSTVGRILAEQLNLPYLDLDEQIAAQAGMPIPEIFAREGESGFRERERRALRGVRLPKGGVVALGGGALLDSHNRAFVEQHGRVLYLHASPERLLHRLRACDEGRPLLAGDAEANLRALLARRAAHYATFSLRLDTTHLSPEEAAWEAQVLLGVFHVRGMGGYDVWVQEGGLDSVGEALKMRGLRGPVAVVSDENVGRWYLSRVRDSLQGEGLRAVPVVIPPGEEHKTMRTVGRLWTAFLDAGLERSSTVVALGGGVVGDLAGFAAATYLRGVPWVVLPTSLLAMVDASLGGKTGADLPQGKNLVGAFHAPRLVLADPDTLATLPPEELRAGMAEVVKHAVISEPSLLEELKGFQELSAPITQVVRRAMAVKVRVIQADPYEKGLRAALNFGHTVGHALELASDFRLRHGEAVAIGMVAETRLAERLGLAERGLADTLADCLRKLGLPTEVPPELERERILRAVGYDKKKRGGKVRFALPVRLGEVRVGVEVESWQALEEM